MNLALGGPVHINLFLLSKASVKLGVVVKEKKILSIVTKKHVISKFKKKLQICITVLGEIMKCLQMHFISHTKPTSWNKNKSILQTWHFMKKCKQSPASHQLL